MANITLKEAKSQYKKHYRYAMRLKEGGKAWQREIDLARHYLLIGTHLYHEELGFKYNGGAK